MKKKILSVFAAVFLGICTVPANVYAAEAAPTSGYQQAEKDALAEFVTGLAAQYAEDIENIDAAMEGTYADLSFTLGDAGRAMLGMAVPVDVSWINDLNLTTDITIDDTATMETTDLLLNGTKLCTMEIMADSSTGDTYIRIPELSESYLSVNYTDAMGILEESMPIDSTDATASIAGIGQGNELMSSFNVYDSIIRNLPDAQVLENIITDYGTMFIESMEENPSGNETITVDDVSQECTTYEGTLNETQAVALIESMLTTARDDSDIKSLFPDDAASAYEDFQAAIDSLLAEFPLETTNENSLAVSKIWVGQNGNIVGRQFSFTDNTGTPISELTWQNPVNGDSSGFLFEINGDGNTVSISGSGSKNGGMLDGNYVLSIDSIPYVSIDVTGYDTEAAKEGNINGVYKLSLLPGSVPDDATYTSVSSFSLVVTLSSDGTAGSFMVDLQSSGASLCSLSCSSGLGDGASLPSLSEIQGTVYDSLNEEEVNAYLNELNVDALMEKLAQAGMPDEFIGQVTALYSSSLSSSSDSYSDYDDYSGYEDYGDYGDYDDYSDYGDYEDYGSFETYGEEDSSSGSGNTGAIGAVAFINSLLPIK